jgi:outer membrane receptor for ferrienterochelin and colicins
MKNYIVALYITLCCAALQAQSISGFVFGQDGNTKTPLQGAIVAAPGGGHVEAVETDSTGFFKLGHAHEQLIISYVGFKTDTVAVKRGMPLTILLKPKDIGEVEVIATQEDKAMLDARAAEIVSGADLLKDACCNMSESFENTVTVDAAYSDAVSGAKEIRMLGLDGVYSQVMTENIPSVRALGNTFGINYIPGPWMSSIYVNKGAGSVVNGYESMTGQINLEYKKPQNSERLFVNYFINQDVRNEINIMGAHKFNEHLSQLTAVHGQINWLKLDMNHDHYIDNPLILNANLLHRWTYQSHKRFNMVAAVSANFEDRRGGEMHFDPKVGLEDQNSWGLRLKTAHAEAFAKTGWSFYNRSSIGIQYKYYYQAQEGYIGRRNYKGKEHFGYVNLIFQKAFDKDDDVIKLGASLLLDDVGESFDTLSYHRREIVPGAFAEATYSFGKHVTIIGGLRVDQHLLYGTFLSPRLNVKWNILHDLSLRVSGGRGYRTPVVFAENFGLLANNRQIVWDKTFKYEEAWNYGASLTYNFFIDFRLATINVDYYRTDFVRQLVIDLEDTRLLQLYSLTGHSYSNSVQVEVGYEVIKGFDVKLAYKHDDVNVAYKSGKKYFPLRPRHRGLVSLGYNTKNKHWRFNTSLNWFGKGRIPSTAVNDADNQRDLKSKDWFQLNAQITYVHKNWEFYLGGENLINFTQKNPIIAKDQPFSNQFDASLIWGPLRGAMAFAGFRFYLK